MKKVKIKTRCLERVRFARHLKLLLEGRAEFPLRLPGFNDPVWNGPPSFISAVHEDYFIRNYRLVLRQPMFDELQKVWRQKTRGDRPFMTGSGGCFPRG